MANVRMKHSDGCTDFALLSADYLSQTWKSEDPNVTTMTIGVHLEQIMLPEVLAFHDAADLTTEVISKHSEALVQSLQDDGIVRQDFNTDHV